MTAPAAYPLSASYRTHAEALVWLYPVLVGDNRALREAIGETLELFAGVRHTPGIVLLEQISNAERFAYRMLLSYLSGYTYTGGGE